MPIDILIAEDEPAARRLYEAALTRAGHRVRLVGSAEEAIDELAQARFDFVVTDKNMPGADGLALLQHLRERYPRTRSLLITGYATADSRAEALALGASAYLEKPFELRALVEAVEAAFTHG